MLPFHGTVRYIKWHLQPSTAVRDGPFDNWGWGEMNVLTQPFCLAYPETNFFSSKWHSNKLFFSFLNGTGTTFLQFAFYTLFCYNNSTYMKNSLFELDKFLFIERGNTCKIIHAFKVKSCFIDVSAMEGYLYIHIHLYLFGYRHIFTFFAVTIIDVFHVHFFSCPCVQFIC
jgi:hypothetical protein